MRPRTGRLLVQVGRFSVLRAADCRDTRIGRGSHDVGVGAAMLSGPAPQSVLSFPSHPVCTAYW